MRVRRFPAADLVALFPPVPTHADLSENARHSLGHVYGSHAWVAARAGVHISTVQRWRDGSRPWLTERTADRVATNWGLHPSEIWDGWFDGIDIDACCDCRPDRLCGGCDCRPEALVTT